MAFKFKRNYDIGSLQAEDDQFLEEAFVDKGDLAMLKNTSNSKCILLGRTGSGKSALINYLESHENYVKRINPESLSLRHLSNSNIVTYFQNLDVKMDLFFKVLWRHVFIVELIKIYNNGELSRSQSFLTWLRDQFGNDPKKQQAINYLEKWEDTFWKDTEHQIKRIECTLENNFKESLGLDIKIPDLMQLKNEDVVETKNGRKTLIEIKHKAQSVISNVQLKEIEQIMTLLKEDLFKNTQKSCYIVIDDLDKEWVSESIVYDLIRALIDTIQEFSRIPNVKIIIALRNNILKKVLEKNNVRGVQREKYKHLYLDIRWSTTELEELLNNRLAIFMRDEYTNESPNLSEILPLASKKKKNLKGFNYMIERSFNRPRDIIDFFNTCIALVDGKNRIPQEVIRKAEKTYSTNRLQALEDEWLENFGDLRQIYGFLYNSTTSFHIADILSNAEDFFVSFLSSHEDNSIAGIWKTNIEEFKKSCDTKELVMEALIILYELGMIGFKKDGQSQKHFIDDTFLPINKTDIEENSRFYIHPMFQSALKVQLYKN